MPNHIRDLSGIRFSHLLVVERAANDAGGRATWRCLCDCGLIIEVKSGALVKGTKKSCGCMKKQMLANHRRRISQTETPEQTIQSRVCRIDKCWIWTGRTSDKDGYGVVHKNGKNIRAHRFSYETYVGPIPEGMFVCHRCDTPACINPDHLFLGTCAENIADSVKKGRFTRGERHRNAKLTEQDVVHILKSGDSPNALAERYGVRPSTVFAVRARKTWKYVECQ